MKHKLSSYLDNIITLLLFVVAGITPLLFFNQTTDFFEIPKLTFLIFATLLLLGLWIFSWIVKGKIEITRTPLDIPLLIILAVVIISTIFSTTRFAAIYGNFPRVHGSAVSWVVYILLYFVTVSRLKTLNQLKNFLYVIYGSGIIVAVISLMSFFKVYLPFDFARSVNFTPTGSSFSAISLLLVLLPLPLLSLAKPNKYLQMPTALTLSILFALTIVLIGSVASYVLLALVIVLSVIAAKPQKTKRTLALFLVPVVVTAVALLAVYLPGNSIQNLEASFPKEIQLPFATSWKVSVSAFRDAPFIGTGPSSYLFNFTTYKPAEFNNFLFWNFSFDTAYNEFLQILGTLGVFGFAAFIILCLVVIAISWRSINSRVAEDSQDISHLLIPGLAISGLATIGLFAIHAATLVSTVVALFMFAALMMSQKSIRERVMEFSIGIKASTQNNKQYDLFPVVLFVLFLFGAAFVSYRTYNAVAADYYHRLALSQANKNGTLTYQYLQKAESLNPEIDLYRVDMAQTNFALANAIAAQKGPTKENPKGTLTDQDRKTIQTLLSQAINEGRVSVALSPRSSRNWEVLASIYRNITGVAQNALAFSLDAYGRSIQRDPLNPALRVSVGGIYYSAKSYDLAVRFFTDAANLKPDYIIAYFNLAITLRDKGDLQNAKIVADQTLTMAQKDPKSPDIKVATALVNDIKDRIEKAAANQQAEAAAQTAPAGQTNSALQNANTNVEVSNLNNPPKVTVPAAVKNNPNANIPKISPVPTKAPVPTVTQ
jgi:putative inorganic carbon (hco3(-)) transporter